MRSIMTSRLLLALALALVVGLPIAGNLYQRAALAVQPDRLATTSDVWTGRLLTDEVQQATADGGKSPSARLVVRFKPQAQRPAQADAHQRAGARSADALALPNTVKVEVAASDLASALATYAARSDVEYVEPDYPVHKHETPNDTSFGSMWGMQKIT
jgi:hypothetical protein